MTEKQSSTMSLVEALSNIAFGFAIALLVQVAVFPRFGIFVSASDNLQIAIIFTAVSVLRTFALRRLFEAVRVSRAFTERFLGR